MHLKSISLNTAAFPAADRYPFNLDILRHTPRIDLVSPVTIFVGENGTGKTTLLRTLVEKCGLFVWGEVENAVDPVKDLLRYTEIEWTKGPVPGSFFSSELFHNFAEIVEEWAEDDPGMLDYFGGKSLVRLSHGESLLSYFRSRYRIEGLYFLDEPETALTPRSQLELLKVLIRTSRAGHAQFIIASHSPILLACPGAQLLSFDGDRVQSVEYERTEHYRLYREFMADRGKFLNES